MNKPFIRVYIHTANDFLIHLHNQNFPCLASHLSKHARMKKSNRSSRKEEIKKEGRMSYVHREKKRAVISAASKKLAR